MNLALSLILPTYNNRALAGASAHKLDRYLTGLGCPFEIIVVEDGSAPRERLERTMLPASAKLIAMPKNRGKGWAVKTGMLAATGVCRIFTDDDLPYDLAFIPEATKRIEAGAHFVGGDRTHPRSTAVVETSTIRRITRRALATILAFLAQGAVRDSQCGFKAFSNVLAEALFPLVKVERFGFDIELYFIMLHHRIACERVPVVYCRAGISSVSAIKDGLITAWEICRIVSNRLSGRYDSADLRRLAG